jgi:hypothetical protein
MTFESEYLGEFEFMYENILGYETGSRTGSIDEKMKKSEIENLVQVYLLDMHKAAGLMKQKMYSEHEIFGVPKCSWKENVNPLKTTKPVRRT